MKLGFRFVPFYLILLVVFFLLLGKLFSLQVIWGGKNRELSEGQRIRTQEIPAPRGIIYDRQGRPLVRNVPGYKIKNQKSNIKNQNYKEYRRISREEALEIEARGGTEAANLRVDILREYLYPQEFAHVLGYPTEITSDELESKSCPKAAYKLGEQIGRAGVEETYECLLRGVTGKELVEVDSFGKTVRTLGKIEPKAGENLTLTVDLDLQKAADEALGKFPGAIVVSDPKTGEILALISHPSFNPNFFTSQRDEEEIQKLFQNEKERPLFNRAISGTYPPGSIFKIITAAAGLETGKINPKMEIEDVGEIIIGPYRFPNWYFIQYGKKEGLLDVVGAIKRSNDIFFYKVAEWVGEKNLGEWAKFFGLGKILGIDLPGEAQGLIPTPDWKEKNIGEKWYLGDTYHFGIGQGYILTTPLQVNFWTAVIANGGVLPNPHLVKTESAKGQSQKFLGEKTVELIREGMRQACSEGGTGWPLFGFKVKSVEIPVACKTGTAEFGDPAKGGTHAWFTVFAPAYAEASAGKPEIVVTVLVEGGGEGSSVAAPIAKKILEEWFSR